ncbi:MAG: hypothetical protein DLM70_19425 [Chloroflexi bacterium]|nr:MAG: hypothetical protein DLM70_19425 [Chloroflexota bacterium]
MGSAKGLGQVFQLVATAHFQKPMAVAGLDGMDLIRREVCLERGIRILAIFHAKRAILKQSVDDFLDVLDSDAITSPNKT